MRQAEIAGISPRTWHPPTTVPGPNPDPAPDLVKRRFDQGRRDVAWFSDITYLATGEGWGYLCTVRDGHTRRVLGRTVADHLRADLVEDALRQAVALRGQLPGKVIFHADRGCQYTSQQSADLAGELDLLRSMGRTGCAGITRPPSRSGPRSRTSTTTGTCSPPSTLPAAAPTPGSTPGALVLPKYPRRVDDVPPAHPSSASGRDIDRAFVLCVGRDCPEGLRRTMRRSSMIGQGRQRVVISGRSPNRRT
ncbi:MAG: DDE-type integrase/transposase/recombinase [Micropruina sp.]|nr:DDE-type integrase/transposase/recombinase [Micropruina sp.]